MLSSESEQYDFVDHSGSGVFGVVGIYERQRDKKLVAVKRVDRLDWRTAFREARILSALTAHGAHNHYIVQFYEYFVDNVYHYIVEEALDQNLTCYQKANALRKFEIGDIRTIAQQLLIALAKLEDMGIVHTDIKQDNILLVDQASQPFRIKLADFGSALTANELAKMWTPYIQTRFIRAPEVLLAYKCNGKIDMWSLGCVMGEMAVGRMLFPSLCELDLAHSIFGTRGLPSAAMMSAGIKTKMFFDWVETKKGSYDWKLKPYKGRQLFSGTRSLRGYAPANLELMRTMEELEHGSKEHDFTELADRKSFLELIDQMLLIDPEQRASPNQALNHPFLTLKHLTGCANYESQHSLREYESAGESLPQDCAQIHQESSEESDPDVPNRKRRSVRRSLRLFFSRLFSRQCKKQRAVSRCSDDALEGPSSAVHGGQPALDAMWEEMPSPDISTGSIENSGSNLAAPEEPPQKRGFLKWLRTCFSGCWRKKSVSTSGSDSSLQGSL